MKTKLKTLARQFVPKKIRYLVGSSYMFQRTKFFMKRRSFMSGNSTVEYRSVCDNIYHCCVQRTGSQWIQKVLFDSRIQMYCGLIPYIYKMPYGYKLPCNIGYRPENNINGVFIDPFPKDTIVGPLYVSFEAYMTIPKPENYKTFFVMRDPRDIVVSWYFSTRYSHAPMGKILERRKILNNMTIQNGMLYSIDELADLGLFDAMGSWESATERSPNVLLLRFEDITGRNHIHFFEKLFQHCDISMPPKVLEGLLRDYQFERLSGRKKGQEDKRNHYRKGVAGDWRNYFNEKIVARFKNVTGELVTRLGYD